MNTAWWVRPTLLVAAVLCVVGLVSLPPDPDLSASGDAPSVSSTVYQFADRSSPNLADQPAIATVPAVAMATASAPARRLTTGATVADTSLPPTVPVRPAPVPGPGGTTIDGRCTQYEPLLDVWSPGWDTTRMSKLMWRESRCTPGLWSSTDCCVSLLQLYVGLHLRDHRLAPMYHECGVWSSYDIDGPDDVERHVCAAAALWSVVGYQGWAL